jgi:hypothetical protein
MSNIKRFIRPSERKERESEEIGSVRNRERERETAGDIDKGVNQLPVEQSEVVWHGTVKPWTDHPKAGNVAKE